MARFARRFIASLAGGGGGVTLGLGVSRAVDTHELYPASNNFPDLSKHNNYMAKVLTPKLYNKLRAEQTAHGWTLDGCIQDGVDNPGEMGTVLPVGCVAGDEQSYEVFSEFFDKVIEERHSGYQPGDLHIQDMDHTKLTGACCLDEDYVLSSRVRTGRSIKDYQLTPAITRAERRHVEKALVDALSNLTGEYKGKYYPLNKMTEDEHTKNVEENLLFEKPSSHIISRDWPDSRGIWHNDARTFVVWINNKDHASIIAMQKGGNVGQVFQRFSKGLQMINNEIRKKGHSFMKNEHLGHIVSCPSNLGTGLRCSVHMKIPLLSQDPRFDNFLSAKKLQKRDIDGPIAASYEKGTYDISNSDRMGQTEIHLTQTLVDGVTMIIKMEKALEKGKSIDSYIPSNVKPTKTTVTVTDTCSNKKKKWWST